MLKAKDAAWECLELSSIVVFFYSIKNKISLLRVTTDEVVQTGRPHYRDPNSTPRSCRMTVDRRCDHQILHLNLVIRDLTA